MPLLRKNEAINEMAGIPPSTFDMLVIRHRIKKIKAGRLVLFEPSEIKKLKELCTVYPGRQQRI